ncbi:MAG: histidinol-phosphate transaminase [Clostridiales bacterium]|nr:histidinol-phosphate transaminase [Clostridiales bacterium]
MSKELFRRELAAFQPYVPGKPIEEVKREFGLTRIEKLASNENQLGPSPLAVEAVRKAAETMNFYPESTAIDLKKELAEHLNKQTDFVVTPDHLVIGNGGEELLQVIAQTFINEGDEIVVPAPSFGIYNTTTGLMGAKTVSVPFKGTEFDLEGMVAAVTDKTKLFYLCSPNNPTGNILKLEQLEYLLQNVPEDVVLILDEAYYEFATNLSPDYPQSLSLLAKRKNLLILRTFSKVCGIAGVRIGYVISNLHIAAEMNKVKLTFNANRLAQEAARGALKDTDHMEKTLALNALSLKLMTEAFDRLGLAYIPSSANFIFVDCKKHSKDVFDQLLRKGVIIRPGYFWGWDNWIRVSTGTEEQTKFFIEKLEEVL